MMRQREGKPGGGKGPLLSVERSLTLATGNDQFLFEPVSESDLTYPSPYRARKLTPIEGERLMGFPDRWTELMGKDAVRWRAIGNAVVVPVAEWVLRRIVDVDFECAVNAR